MKYIIWIWLFCTMPYIGCSQSAGRNKEGGKKESIQTFLNVEVAEGRVIVFLPESSLGQHMLFTRVGRLDDYETKQVVFSKHGGQVYMEEHKIWSETGIWLGVSDNPNWETNVLGVFSIQEEHDRGYRFDITDMLFDTSLGWATLSSAPTVPSLSKLIGTKQLDDEIMIKIQTGRQEDTVKIIQPVYYSFLKLGEPMEARRFDYRMSFWIESMKVSRDHTKNDTGSITRWRLEKKYKDRETSVPVKPITFTLSPDIPKQWRPYVKAGIEEWLPAFEAAGFKDAIVVNEVDTLDEWSKFSLGHSMVRWFRNKNIRYFGDKPRGSNVTYVVDQRSGEIIKSDVLIGSSYQHLMDQYFIRCAALDERAQTYPVRDDLLGELIQSLVAHETGHSLGITDNSYGEYRYPVEKMGDVEWLRTMGHTPSIMNYARHNNLAQPEDHVPASLLIQKAGPTDAYYIRWGYQEFPEYMSAVEKADSLERIIRLQDTVPWYRYTKDQGGSVGPVATNNVVESNDPVKGAQLALKNLERAIALLPTINKGKKDNVRMERIYRKAIDLWWDIMRNVKSLVRGYDVFYKSMDQSGHMYDPIPMEDQQEAMNYFLEQAFNPPHWLSRPSFQKYAKLSVHPDYLLTKQQMLLREMLEPKYLKRMQYMETLDGYEGTMKDYFVRLQNGLFSELQGNKQAIDPRRQGLQATYIDWLIKEVVEERKEVFPELKIFVHTDYAKGIMIGRLMELKGQLERKLSEKKHSDERGHWELCLLKLNKAFGT
ncbi:zinc-dependent metalloprotease [Allomuricauda taeanensis]|uniref:zinc-dependent metalloprotease n=1 Tax=Flagellimonas taeanensis TaxID=1005926 RepID=UPI002E7AF387|nr:zinc-dependent metalloprotease [Allomuricauda taeanensis]MEE1963962.1 zinc-dependent metalloprotease [Allomuricauda taeanensis]